MQAQMIYSINMLPVAHITDVVQTVFEARSRLKLTLKIVDEIRMHPAGFPRQIQQHLDNIRFHVVNGLGLIDVFLRSQVSFSAGHRPAVDVVGLSAAITNHIREISRARVLWKDWQKDIQGDALLGEAVMPMGQDETDVLAPVGPTPTGVSTGVPQDNAISKLAEPQKMSNFISLAVIGFGALGAYYVFKGLK